MAQDSHIYELRIYAIAPGRLTDMARRFREDIRRLFPRHGIRIVGSWTAISGPKMPAFVYLMRWSSFEERTAAFGRFAADPEWQETRARTNGPSELVEHYDIQFLGALDSTGVSEPMALDGVGLFELALHPASNGRAVAMRESLLGHELPACTRAGASMIGAFEAMTGPRLPGLVSLLRWDNAAAWERGHATIDGDPSLRERRAHEIATEGRCILGAADRYLLRPVEVAWESR